MTCQTDCTLPEVFVEQITQQGLDVMSNPDLEKRKADLISELRDLREQVLVLAAALKPVSVMRFTGAVGRQGKCWPTWWAGLRLSSGLPMRSWLEKFPVFMNTLMKIRLRIMLCSLMNMLKTILKSC